MTPRLFAGTMLCAGSLLLGVHGCRESLSGFGAGIRARTVTDQFFGAMADRHVELVRSPKYEYARVAQTRGALSPSRVFDDTAAWTGSSGAVRVLESYGTHAGNEYLLTSHRNVPPPAKPADARHVTTLSRLSDNQYQWDTAVDFAVGTAKPNEIALVISRLLTAGEGLNERDAHAEFAKSLPRASLVLGELFSLDTLKPVQLTDGSTAVTLSVGVHSEQFAQKFPAFGDYVRRYVDPARFHFIVTDAAGNQYVDIDGRDRAISVRLRSHDGRLVPLTGPVKPIPDSLVITADLTLKVKMFNVGFHDLSLDFVNSARNDREHDWTLNARREPHWNLPFFAARLVRAPLRYPFAGEGMLFRLGVRGGAGEAQTVIVRQGRLAVQESAILKFFNSLTSTAMNDFGVRVEHEENQWLREVFLALRDDARGVLAP
ncbi:MAG: hypothetical protein M3Z05_09905 [Gemmatimonadota bacterium]|nr:hypothetical protein [Gemmatimonadota bacterium]